MANQKGFESWEDAYDDLYADYEKLYEAAEHVLEGAGWDGSVPVRAPWLGGCLEGPIEELRRVLYERD